MYKFPLILGFFCLLMQPVKADTQEQKQRIQLDNEDFTLRLIPRTPDQIAAFYSARGFPADAVKLLTQVCFIGIGLQNKTSQTVWFNLENWSFTAPNGKVKRILRSDWKQQWADIKLAKRFQSIFRWTLMPEKLDFHEHEREGGNITLVRTNQPISIKATIVVGQHKTKNFNIEFKNIYCAEDKHE